MNTKQLILSTWLLTTIGFSQITLALDRHIYFVGASAGRTFTNVTNSKPSANDKGTLAEVILGEYFNENDVSLEAAVVALDSYAMTSSNGTQFINTDMDVQGLKLLAAKHFIVTNKLYLNVRGGLLYWKEKHTNTVKNDAGELLSNSEDSLNGTSIYIGLGYSYSLTKDSRLQLTLESYKTDNVDFNNALAGIIFSFD